MMQTWRRSALAILAMLVVAGVSWSCGGSAPEESARESGAEAADDSPDATEAPPEVLVAPEAPVAPPAEAVPAAEDVGTDRPAQVSVTLSNSRFYDGTYTATGRTRYCGNAMRVVNGKVNGFNFEFPLDGILEVGDVTFAAEEFPTGTSTAAFYLSVSVKGPRGQPPAFVFRTNQPQFREVGKAARSEDAGTTRLVVEGVNDRAEQVRMTAECGPRSR